MPPFSADSEPHWKNHLKSSPEMASQGLVTCLVWSCITVPANLDYLLSHETTSTVAGKPVILITTLWKVLTRDLGGIWPEGRTKFSEKGRGLGDVWRVSTLDYLHDGISLCTILC